MKKFVLPLALLASLSAYGHDVFVYNGLNPKPVQTATGLRSIVFGDDALTFKSADGTTTVAVADMDHFTFYRRADIAGIRLQTKDNTGSCTVYSPDGRALGNRLELLPAGIYIMKITAPDGTVTTQKLIKK